MIKFNISPEKLDCIPIIAAIYEHFRGGGEFRGLVNMDFTTHVYRTHTHIYIYTLFSV